MDGWLPGLWEARGTVDTHRAHCIVASVSSAVLESCLPTEWGYGARGRAVGSWNLEGRMERRPAPAAPPLDDLLQLPQEVLSRFSGLCAVLRSAARATGPRQMLQSFHGEVVFSRHSRSPRRADESHAPCSLPRCREPHPTFNSILPGGMHCRASAVNILGQASNHDDANPRHRPQVRSLRPGGG